jgi:ribosome-associated toxin RatA of RatAB toxin-antitoxin module
MIDIDFSTDIPIKIDPLFQILTDYSKLKELIPSQVKECKILQKTNEETITEELLTFNTYFKKQKIIQRTSHKIFEPYTILNSTIDGPFKGSTLEIILEEKDEGTKVNLKGKCKVSLKYRILSPVIKKYYKMACVSLLYKINNKYNLKLSN